MYVFLNSQIIPMEEAKLAINDRGFTLGDGLFETIVFHHGVCLRFGGHYARLAQNCATLGILLPYSKDDFYNFACEVAEKNNIQTASIRITLSRGPADRGLICSTSSTPTLTITAAPYTTPKPRISAIISTQIRRNEFSPTTQMKTLNYLDNILAAQEARKRNADDAILLNTQGRLAESTISNLFLVVDGHVITPACNEGILPGVLRREIIALTNAKETHIPPKYLAMASEVFLSNSHGLRQIIEIDGVAINRGRDGDLFQDLKERFNLPNAQ
jgi:branched-chain amino acid aminotransferase